jgi:geranylgeranyl diphosphate synthase type II
LKSDSVFDIRPYLESRKARVDQALDLYLPREDMHPGTLHKAMRYSVFSGGKRFRPILSLAAFDACRGSGQGIMPIACAIELIHTYSLIHDDLPCMDDDDLRRGKPTTHKVFGEATAVLAGDALLSLAFGILAEDGSKYLGVACAVKILRDVACAIGSDGMVGGQIIDMESEGREVDLKTVE